MPTLQKSGSDSLVNLDYYKNNGPRTKFSCKYHGCKLISQPNCYGFCREDNRTILDVIDDPAPYPLVLPEDHELIGESLWLALEQMVPCNLSSSEMPRVTFRVERVNGFPGFACKHCMCNMKGTKTGRRGQSATGRWFPSSSLALYSHKFTNSLVNHFQKCPHCPQEVRYHSYSSCQIAFVTELYNHDISALSPAVGEREVKVG